QLAGLRDVDGVAGKLHAELRSTKRGGADAFAGGQQFPRHPVEALAQFETEAAAEVAEVAALAAVDVFAHPAGEHDAADAREIGERRGEVEPALAQDRDARSLGHPLRDDVERPVRHALTKREIEAGLPGERLTLRIQARDAARG